ncbi:hypothetical protein ACFX16_009426 [Malus domestica]
MDRDREANTRCTWFTQIGYVHGVEEFSLIVKGLHKYIGSSSPLVDVASSLEVLFLHPGVVSLTGRDAQGVPQVAELGDLPKEVTNYVSLFLNWAEGFSSFLQSIRLTQEFEGQNKFIKSRVRSTLMIWDTFVVDKMWYLFWKHKMLKMSTREQCQVITRPKETTGKKHDMGYSCF